MTTHSLQWMPHDHWLLGADEKTGKRGPSEQKQPGRVFKKPIQNFKRFTLSLKARKNPAPHTWHRV